MNDCLELDTRLGYQQCQACLAASDEMNWCLPAIKEYAVFWAVDRVCKYYVDKDYEKRWVDYDAILVSAKANPKNYIFQFFATYHFISICIMTYRPSFEKKRLRIS